MNGKIQTPRTGGPGVCAAELRYCVVVARRSAVLRLSLLPDRPAASRSIGFGCLPCGAGGQLFLSGRCCCGGGAGAACCLAAGAAGGWEAGGMGLAGSTLAGGALTPHSNLVAGSAVLPARFEERRRSGDWHWRHCCYFDCYSAARPAATAAAARKYGPSSAIETVGGPLLRL